MQNKFSYLWLIQYWFLMPILFNVLKDERPDIFIYIKNNIIWAYRMWPAIWTVLILIVHLCIYSIYPTINKLICASLPAIGAILVVYTINENMGMIKKINLISTFKQYLENRPKLIKQNGTFVIANITCATAMGSCGLITASVQNTLDERIDYLQKQINECKELIIAKEKETISRLNDIRDGLSKDIFHNRNEIDNVKAHLENSVIGSTKSQIFGVILVIYGAIVSVLESLLSN